MLTDAIFPFSTTAKQWHSGWNISLSTTPASFATKCSLALHAIPSWKLFPSPSNHHRTSLIHWIWVSKMLDPYWVYYVKARCGRVMMYTILSRRCLYLIYLFWDMLAIKQDAAGFPRTAGRDRCWDWAIGWSRYTNAQLELPKRRCLVVHRKHSQMYECKWGIYVS